jgi:hypothetical protein
MKKVFIKKCSKLKPYVNVDDARLAIGPMKETMKPKDIYLNKYNIF